MARVSEALTRAVQDRELGLLTQSEYEARLDEVRAGLETGVRLMEVDRPGGGSRFLLRNPRTGVLLARLEVEPR